MKTRSADWPIVLFKRRGLYPFIAALALVAGATAVRVPFKAALGEASPFLFYWPSVLTVALIFGLKPAVLAAAASVFLADYFWMPPFNGWGLNEVEFLQVLTFGFGSSALACLSEWLHAERQGKEHLRSILATTQEAILTTDCAGKIRFVNPAAQLLLGVTSEEAVGQSLTDKLSLVQLPEPRRRDELLPRALFEDVPLGGPLMLVGKGGRQHLVKVTVSRMLNYKRQKTGNVIVVHVAEEPSPVRAP